jgi:hypothetical protein
MEADGFIYRYLFIVPEVAEGRTTPICTRSRLLVWQGDGNSVNGAKQRRAR